MAAFIYEYGHLVCEDEGDLLPLFFGAYFHDSIEDARPAYNDIRFSLREIIIEEIKNIITP